VPILSVRDVTVRFGGIIALDDVSFDIEARQIVGLIGPNGAGKTTLFNCLSRLYTPSAGVITFEGASLLSLPPHRIPGLGFGRTFQNLALFPTQTVLQNVMVGAHSRTRSDFLSNALKLRYGKDYLKGFEDGLGEAAKKMIVLKQSYEVTDPTIDSQIVNLKNSGATVFFNITIPKFAVQAIKKSHDIGWKPVHYLNNVSSSLATVLKPAGLEASKDLITALYMKEVTDPQWRNDKGFTDWVAFMKKYYPEGALDDQANGYGYNVAMLMTIVLKQCGADLSRENIMKQAANLKNVELPLLLPGIKINTSPTDFAPIEQEQLAKFNGEKWETFGDLFDAFRKQ